MARLRYNGLTATLGADLLTAGTTITFASKLIAADGDVPTISGSDYIPLAIVADDGTVLEILHLTAYTSGATTGTVLRAQESTLAADHPEGTRVVHGPTAADFTDSAAADASWTAATLQGSWSDLSGFGTAGYRKDASGVVHLRGVVTGGSAVSTIFTLPSGYRPAQKQVHAAQCSAGLARVDILTTGVVEFNAGTAWVSLNGLTFWSS